MNIPSKNISIVYILLICILNACNPEEPKYIPPTLLNFPDSGLLGQSIVIEVENVEIGKLQVFFDTEETQVNYVSDKEIMVIVPRTIKTNTATLKVIDLNENKTILNKTFSLKKPIISKYSSDKITFNENFTIYGENFDTMKDFIAVSVNNENATIINVDYNKIEIQIPNKIKTANLEIKVKAQLQEATSTLPLLLESPEIIGINNSSAWLGSQLIVFGKNFNPNLEFGEVFINDIPCYFTAANNKLIIDIPPGPYKDFKITNVTYKTAGLSTSFDFTVPIVNDVIVVDYINGGVIPNSVEIPHTVFEYNNKAYAFKKDKNDNYSYNDDYTLLEFSPITEKWTELPNFHYKGFLTDAVYDGKDAVYLYKRSTITNEFTLTKLDLKTYKEVEIDLPYSNKIYSPILFAYQDNLYMLSGLNITNNSVTSRTEKYKYSATTNTWSVLPNSTFSNLPLVSNGGSGKCKYLFQGNNIYITYNLNRSFKITPNLSATEYPNFLFKYSNAIFALAGYNYLYNINTNKYMPLDSYNYFRYSEYFFNLNNEIYFLGGSWSGYYQNTLFTQRLRKEILNGIL